MKRAFSALAFQRGVVGPSPLAWAGMNQTFGLGNDLQAYAIRQKAS